MRMCAVNLIKSSVDSAEVELWQGRISDFRECEAQITYVYTDIQRIESPLNDTADDHISGCHDINLPISFLFACVSSLIPAGIVARLVNSK